VTAEQVFMYAKSYRLYFATDNYDFMKYSGHIKTPALITQRDRQFYYRLSTKLNDEQIHATLLTTHFYKPTAYIADVCTPESLDAGIRFASRTENGVTLFAHELYALRKSLPSSDLYEWLYGSEDSMLPGCIQSLINKELPIDLACLLLLIPREEFGYRWAQYYEEREPSGSSFGIRPWITRLRKADQLIRWRRTAWRQFSYKLSQSFWSSYQLPSLAPMEAEQHLFA
jgi:hypothetical protein